MPPMETPRRHDVRCTFYGFEAFPRTDCRQCELLDSIQMLNRECAMNKAIIDDAQKTIRHLETELDRLERQSRYGV
jgi:hypothetical protein